MTSSNTNLGLPKYCKNLIIGAGPSGLTLAHQLLALGHKDVLILEAASSIGGLCQSTVSEDGAVFDIGGHSFHTPHPRVKALVDGLVRHRGGMQYQKRDARIRFNGEEIGYPFQQNFQFLKDRRTVAECKDGLVAEKHGVPSNLEEHLRLKFGAGICEHFMLPYNRKLWRFPLKEIAHDWASERVADTKAQDPVMKDTRKPLEADSLVGYPSLTGFDGIFESLAEWVGHDNIRLNCKVTRIIEDEKTVVFWRYGKVHYMAYDRLFSTMPLPNLMDMATFIHVESERCYTALRHTSLLLVRIITDHYKVNSPQRLYTADAESLAHKYAFNNLSSSEWAETKNKAIMAEISFIGSELIPVQKTYFMQNSLIWLAENGYLPTANSEDYKGDVLEVKYSYPIYTHGRKEVVDRSKEILKKHSIYSLGRFGSWHYMNSDGCINEAILLAESVS